MLAEKRFIGWVLVLCLVGTAFTDPEEVKLSLQDLNQTDAEIILNAQTILRRYLINVFSRIQEEILEENRFYAAIQEIVRGLQERDLDPLKAFRDDGSSAQVNQSLVFKMANVIHRLQGCRNGETSQHNWHSFFQSISKINALIPHLPGLIITAQHFQMLNSLAEPFVAFVLTSIQRNRFNISGRLLADILYNYRFRNYSPDVKIAAENIIQLLEKEKFVFPDFQWATGDRPNEILTNILTGIQTTSSLLRYQATQLLSALSDNIQNRKGRRAAWTCLDIISNDDYPADVVQAKDDLILALRSNQTGIDMRRMSESLVGYTQLEVLLGLLSKLTLIPEGNPLSSKVHALYPHVKLKYLTSKGKFFRPQTSSDIAFLLNSFLTVKTELNSVLVREIHKILPDVQWKSVLVDFDFSKYSQPRPLIIDILREILRVSSNNLPICDFLMFRYFISNNSQDLGCTSQGNDDFLSQTLTRSTTPGSVLPDTGGSFGSVTATTMTAPAHLPPVFSVFRIPPPNTTISSPPHPIKRCSTGTPSKFIDPVLKRVSLTDKATPLPEYVLLCPEEIRELEAKAQTQKQPEVPTPPPEIAIPDPKPCKNVIDQNSLIDIAKNDSNYDKIQFLVSGEVIDHEEYKAFSTREEVLKAVLENKKKTTENPEQQSVIPTIILRLVVSEEGQLPPVIIRICPPPSACPVERRTKLLNPQDLMAAIQPEHRSQLIVDLITNKPIPYEIYGRYPTRRDILMALSENRAKEMQRIYPNTNMSVTIKKTPFTDEAELPATVTEICEKVESNQCKQDEELKKVIDPRCLLEIVDDKATPEIEELLLDVAIPADEFLQLGDRKTILLHFLKHFYLGRRGSLADSQLGILSLTLKINEKGNLPPIVRMECVTKTTDPTPETVSPPRYPKLSQKVPNQGLSSPEMNLFPKIMKESNPPRTDSKGCLPNEIQTLVLNPGSIFTALNTSTPNNSPVQEQIKPCQAACYHTKNHTKAEVVEIILDALLSGVKDEEIIENVNQLKSFVIEKIRGQEKVPVIIACLPRKTFERGTITEDECMVNEALVPVVKTNTILQALGPVPPGASYPIKSFIILVGISENHTKGDILSIILNNLQDIMNSTEKEVIEVLKSNILESGHLLESSGMAQVCLSYVLIQEVQKKQPLGLPVPTQHSPTETPLQSSSEIPDVSFPPQSSESITEVVASQITPVVPHLAQSVPPLPSHNFRNYYKNDSSFSLPPESQPSASSNFTNRQPSHPLK